MLDHQKTGSLPLNHQKHTIPEHGYNNRGEPISRAIIASEASPELYNQELAPVKQENCTWTAYSIFSLWVNDVHSLGNYIFAISLFALGLGAWQIFAALSFGSFFLFALLTLSGYMGIRTGMSFPVISRISFGTRGAKIPALLRGGVAIIWLGIQTYLASVVLSMALLVFFPALEPLTLVHFLGLSALGWFSFTLLWLIQLCVACFGMEAIRHYQAIAGPVILVSFIALAVWILNQAEWTLQWAPVNALTGSAMWLQILGGAALWVTIYGTFILNFCDFTRSAQSRRAIILGNFWGIPINMFLFAVLVVIMTGGQLSIDGTMINTPVDIVKKIPNLFLLGMASLSLLILTIAVNLMANFVAPTFTLMSLFPQSFNFRRAVILSALISFVILPWNLYNSPVVIVYFLGGLGAFLGPIFGIIMSDYWLVRKQNIHVAALYSNDPNGPYHYYKGVNLKALQALIPASIIALIFAFVPNFSFLSQFSWFISAGLAALFYYILTPKIATSKRIYPLNQESSSSSVLHHY